MSAAMFNIAARSETITRPFGGPSNGFDLRIGLFSYFPDGFSALSNIHIPENGIIGCRKMIGSQTRVLRSV
jgi:hypothetical protein